MTPSIPLTITLWLTDAQRVYLRQESADFDMAVDEYVQYLVAEAALDEACAQQSLRRGRQPRRRRQGAAPVLRLVRQPDSDTAS